MPLHSNICYQNRQRTPIANHNASEGKRLWATATWKSQDKDKCSIFLQLFLGNHVTFRFWLRNLRNCLVAPDVWDFDKARGYLGQVNQLRVSLLKSGFLGVFGLWLSPKRCYCVHLVKIQAKKSEANVPSDRSLPWHQRRVTSAMWCCCCQWCRPHFGPAVVIPSMSKVRAVCWTQGPPHGQRPEGSENSLSAPNLVWKARDHKAYQGVSFLSQSWTANSGQLPSHLLFSEQKSTSSSKLLNHTCAPRWSAWYGHASYANSMRNWNVTLQTKTWHNIMFHKCRFFVVSLSNFPTKICFHWPIYGFVENRCH